MEYLALPMMLGPPGQRVVAGAGALSSRCLCPFAGGGDDGGGGHGELELDGLIALCRQSDGDSLRRTSSAII